MIENYLFGKGLNIMERELDATSLRQRVISNNLANVDTPDFKRSDVVFEDELKKAMNEPNRISGFLTNEKHIPIGNIEPEATTPSVVLDNSTTMRNDGNNVDIDREMALQGKNSLMYDTVAQLLNGDLRKIKSAIEGR